MNDVTAIRNFAGWLNSKAATSEKPEELVKASELLEEKASKLSMVSSVIEPLIAQQEAGIERVRSECLALLVAYKSLLATSEQRKAQELIQKLEELKPEAIQAVARYC